MKYCNTRSSSPGYTVRGIFLAVPLVLLMPHALVAAGDRADDDATGIVRAAIDHWRGKSSYSEMTMTIHRPDWERSMSMRAWTVGDERSLVRVTAPRRDAGNGTLLDDDSMWTYSPRVNRVIKVPSSMMSQSWMGSDFSNKDISRAGRHGSSAPRDPTRPRLPRAARTR